MDSDKERQEMIALQRQGLLLEYKSFSEEMSEEAAEMRKLLMTAQSKLCNMEIAITQAQKQIARIESDYEHFDYNKRKFTAASNTPLYQNSKRGKGMSGFLENGKNPTPQSAEKTCVTPTVSSILGVQPTKNARTNRNDGGRNW